MVPHVAQNPPVKIIWAMKLAIIVRESLHQEEESMGYITLHTGGIDGMRKNPKVQCQVLGAHAKMEL